MSRQKMLAEYRVWNSLTEKEQKFISENKLDNFISALYNCSPTKKEGGGCHNKKRKETLLSQANLLEKPPTPLEDTPNWISYEEENLLGIPISANKVDSYNVDRVNTTCKEFLCGKTGYLVLGVEIKEVREYKIRRGKSEGKLMAYLIVTDGTCDLDSVCVFPEAYEKFQDILIEGNLVGLQGDRDKKRDSLIVKNSWLLST